MRIARRRLAAVATALTVVAVAATTTLAEADHERSRAAAPRASLVAGRPTVAVPTGEATASTPGHASATRWSSGVYPGATIDTAAVRRFAAYRGRAVDVVSAYTDRRSWADFADDLWCVQQYHDFAGRLAIAVPLTLGDTSLADVASGAADHWFATYARHLAALGRGHSDLRLGWDANRDRYPWSAHDADAFRAAFRHVARLLKATLPAATIDYSGTWGTGEVGHDAFTTLYPGDDVVDVIGLDAYAGGGVPARTAAGFARWAAADHGLDDWLSFARRHGKRLSLPEWGVTAAGDDANTAFVAGMFAFLRTHAADIAYEAYFNDADAALSPSESAVPRHAAAEYRRLWGSLG